MLGVENVRVICTTAALEETGIRGDRELLGTASRMNDNKALMAPDLISELPSTSAKVVVACGATGDTLERNGNNFLHMLKDEQTRLLLLAAEAENCIAALSNSGEGSEDVLGLLRAAAGKARLLVSQKMRQFGELCHKNLSGHSPGDKLPITADDLQGFWDMVSLQIGQVDEIFADVKRLEGNGWKRIEEPPTDISTTRAPRKPKPKRSSVKTINSKVIFPTAAKSAKSEAATLKREAQRRLLLELKRTSREALAAGNAADSA